MKYCHAILSILLLHAVNGQAKDSLRDYYNKGNYFKLRTELRSANIAKDQALFYGTLVANAFNQNDLAIQKADSFLKVCGDHWNDTDVVQILEMQMDSYGKTYHYSKAADLASLIMDKYRDVISKTDVENIRNIYNIYAALKGTPPQTINQTADVMLHYKRNNVNLVEIPVTINGGKESFIFDTGANISTISESVADKWHLKRIKTDVNVSALQGKKVHPELGIADSLSIGNITYHNVVFLVLPDQNLDFPQAHFKIKGIIGFPVLSAFKEIQIYRDSIMKFPVRASDTHLSNMELNGLSPIVQVATGKDTLLFQFDTGAQITQLFSNYYQQHKAYITEHAIRSKKKYGGAGGVKKMKVYSIKNFGFRIADDTVVLRNVDISTSPNDYFDNRAICGNMGQDVIAQFNEMIISFDKMYLDFKK